MKSWDEAVLVVGRDGAAAAVRCIAARQVRIEILRVVLAVQRRESAAAVAVARRDNGRFWFSALVAVPAVAHAIASGQRPARRVADLFAPPLQVCYFLRRPPELGHCFRSRQSHGAYNLAQMQARRVRRSKTSSPN